MKNQVILAVALLLSPLVAPKQVIAQQAKYSVHGRLVSTMKPTKAYLSYQTGATAHLDSTAVKNGRFLFNGTVDSPTAAILYVVTPGTFYSRTRELDKLPLYLQAGQVEVTSPDSLAGATLRGTPLNNDQHRLNVALRSSDAQLATLRRNFEAAPAKQRENRAFGLEFRQHYLEGIAAQRIIYKQFIEQNPQSMLSLYSLDKVTGYPLDVAVAKPLFKGLAPAIRQSAAGQAYAMRLAQAQQLMVGALAPDFTQNDSQGKPVKLSDLRGKYVLIDFWASWCGPCRAENPNVVANFTKYRNRNFTVLGVSLDKPNGREAWLKAIEADGLTWTQVSDLKYWQNEVAQLYSVNSIPKNFLISPDGHILAKDIRGEDLGQKLATLLPATTP